MVSRSRLNRLEKELASIGPGADNSISELYENLFEKIAKYRDNEKPAEKTDSLIYIAAKGREDLIDEIIKENGQRSQAATKLKNLYEKV